MIAHALTTFHSNAAVVPGRFNVMQIDGVQVVLDYAHNQAAMAALSQGMAALGKRRTIMVMGLPGDRRDEDLIATAMATLPMADEYVLHDIDDLRGRRKLEVPELLMKRLVEHARCNLAASSDDAIRLGWQSCRPGDRLLIIADEVDCALKTLQSLAQTVDDDASCVTQLAANLGSGITYQHDVHAHRKW
jgi:cyanophycin synthetase